MSLLQINQSLVYMYLKQTDWFETNLWHQECYSGSGKKLWVLWSTGKSSNYSCFIITSMHRDPAISWSECCHQRRVRLSSWTSFQCSTVAEGNKALKWFELTGTCSSSLYIWYRISFTISNQAYKLQTEVISYYGLIN